MHPSSLQHQLIRHVHRLRNNQFVFSSLDQPQSVTFDEIVTSWGTQRRCRVVLTAHGCQVATCTMCPLPDEAVPRSTPVSTDNWISQLRSALPSGTPADVLTVFHNGNFFNDREVSPERRAAIYAWLRTTSVSTLVVESLPQFLTADRLAHARRSLGPHQRIEVAIGLQSADGYLRETVLGSTCTEDGFAAALVALRGQGFGYQVFLMHQMPFLTPQEASAALYTSVRKLRDTYDIEDPTLCPLRVAPATVVHELHQQGNLQLASLWHLVDVLQHIRKTVSGSRSRVAVSLLQPSTPDAPHTDGCPLCRGDLRAWVSEFNIQKEGPAPARCTCAPAPVNFEATYEKTDVELRIQKYLAAKHISVQPKPGTPTGCTA